MAPRERLLPSLLDRLIDDAPQARSDTHDRRAFSMVDLRRAVRRDLEWLLNTVNLESSASLASEPAVRDSVINFGMPALSGVTLDRDSRASLQRRLREVILVFEPRILPDTLRVLLESDENIAKGDDHAGGLVFRIEGMLWGQPLPEPLYLRTEIDLESGDVDVIEN